MDKESNLIFEKYQQLNEDLGLGHGTPKMVEITAIGQTKPLKKKVAPPIEDEMVYIQAGEEDSGCGCDDCNGDHSESNDYDGEIDMARAELLKANEYAAKLFQHIGKKDNIEGWVASKITKASDYLSSVYHYLDYEDNFNAVEDEEDDDIEIDDDDLTKTAKETGFGA
tara:strand:- start:1035 stop:1538 length:504 start_codon:yes stop_codon:yes gene_type:complete